MTDVEKTHPCPPSSGGVATEHYCRAMNRQMNTQLSACAHVACTSPWRFCPVCIVVRALPIHTLREGGVCKEHGAVGNLSRKEVIQRGDEIRKKSIIRISPQKTPPSIVMEEKRRVVVEKKPALIQKRAPQVEAPPLVEKPSPQKVLVSKLSGNTTLDSLSRRLGRAMRLRLNEKKRRLKWLGKRLTRFRITPGRIALKAFILRTYHLAVLENVVRAMPKGPHSPLPTLWDVTKYASKYLEIGHRGFHVRVNKRLTEKDLEELGIQIVTERRAQPAKELVKKVHEYDFARFDSEFDEECRTALMRMSSYHPKRVEDVVREFNAIPRSQWADWGSLIDPLDVAHAIQTMCADGKMDRARAGVLFGRPEYWVEIVLKLHKLTPVVRGLIGPKASPNWRLQFGQAVLVSSQQPSKQLACARGEMWRVVRSRYKT